MIAERRNDVGSDRVVVIDAEREGRRRVRLIVEGGDDRGATGVAVVAIQDGGGIVAAVGVLERRQEPGERIQAALPIGSGALSMYQRKSASSVSAAQ